MTDVHVAVGVIRDTEGRILISKRHASSHQGGLWEFPGGQVEVGETVRDALSRELKEELGIEVRATRPLLEIKHDYGDKQVLLDVWLVDRFEGEADGMEGQPLRWVAPPDLSDFDFPAANVAIVEAVLRL